MTTMLPSTRVNTTTIKCSVTLTIINDFVGLWLLVHTKQNKHLASLFISFFNEQ
jgi:hydrogenase maturation factor